MTFITASRTNLHCTNTLVPLTSPHAECVESGGVEVVDVGLADVRFGRSAPSSQRFCFGLDLVPHRDGLQPKLQRAWRSTASVASDLGDDEGLRLEGDAFASAATLAQSVEIVHIFNG